jgi:hypothetical protein
MQKNNAAGNGVRVLGWGGIVNSDMALSWSHMTALPTFMMNAMRNARRGNMLQ